MSPAAAVGASVLEGWVARYGTELHAHVARFVGADEAEDVLQQVWITAHGRPPALGPSANVRGWLYRVATNAALDRLERERRRKRLLERGASRVQPEEGGEPEASAAAPDEVRARVRAAVARLPRKQREAVWLRWADGLDYEQISERLGCSRESARANVYQGMKRLRHALAELLKEEAR